MATVTERRRPIVPARKPDNRRRALMTLPIETQASAIARGKKRSYLSEPLCAVITKACDRDAAVDCITNEAEAVTIVAEINRPSDLRLRGWVVAVNSITFDAPADLAQALHNREHQRKLDAEHQKWVRQRQKRQQVEAVRRKSR